MERESATIRREIRANKLTNDHYFYSENLTPSLLGFQHLGFSLSLDPIILLLLFGLPSPFSPLLTHWILQLLISKLPFPNYYSY